jgi:CubicO group peptidase (beta-lactamase class C family)
VQECPNPDLASAILVNVDRYRELAIKKPDMQKPVLFLFLFLFNASGLFARQKDRSLEKQLDKLMAAACKPNEPGVAVLVGRQGKIVYEKAFGSAQVELQVPLRPDMVFKIGSVTKQFTAIGILQLVEQGKLSLQDSIQQYVKDFPDKGYTITIEHLLTHTSGIRDYQNIDHPDPYIQRHDLTPRFLIDHFKNAPLEFKPGTRYWYTNSGYVLLAYIIEQVSGQLYHNYMREHVLQPAGLPHTYYALENAIIPKRVAGYTRDRGYYENTYYQSLTLAYGAGDLLSTVEDLYQWHKALYAYTLIKKETLEKAFTPYTLSNGLKTEYGYGWFNNMVNESKCIHHEGQVSGFIAVEQYFPEEDVFVAILTNVQSGEDKTDFSDRRFELFNTISRLALGKSINKEITLSDADADSYTGVYTLGDASGKRNTIFRKDGHLIIQLPGGSTFKMMPVAKDRFVLVGIRTPATLTFMKDDKGEVVKLVIVQKGRFNWDRVADVADSAAGKADHPLAVYTGKYQESTTPGSYTYVTVSDNVLMTESSTGLPKTAMTPVSANTFRVKTERFEFLYEFIKDKNGKVQKLVVTQDAPVELTKVR